MQDRYWMFQRKGVFYAQDKLSGKQQSLKTRDAAAARRMFAGLNQATEQPQMNLAMAKVYLSCKSDGMGLRRVGEWITRGRGGVTQRALRLDIVLLCLCPQFLPCKHPSGAWVSRRHGISRTRANHLRKEFASFIAPHIQFRGQRFLNRGNVFQK